MADANLDGRTGSTTPGRITRPETTGAQNTHSDTPSTSAPGNSASASASASASTSTLHSNSSTTTSSPQRININHNPSTNSLRNINTGGAGIETGTGRGTGAVQNAALTGAALAFSNAKGKATPAVPNKFVGKTQLGGRARSPSKVSVMDAGTGGGQQIYGHQKVGRERTGDSETDGGSINGGLEYQGGQRIPQKRNQRPNGHLLPPFSGTSETSPKVKNNSAAFMAANLAAKRSRESSPNHTGQNYGMGMGMGKQASPLPSRRQSYASSIDSMDRRVDLSSIPPTSNLVEMWEQPDKGVKKAGGVVGNRGNEMINRPDQKRPVSSHAPVPVLKPAGLARPVSSHASESSVKPRIASEPATISEQAKSKLKPVVHPRPSSSQASMSGLSKSDIQPPPVSSHTTSSEGPKPSPKPPAQKPVMHNTRPASSHGPTPNLSTKPSIQKLSRPVSSHGPPPVKPLVKPSLQSIRPTSSYTPESIESSSKASTQKPSLPPPRRTPANLSASGDQSTNLPMHAPQPRSMQSPILTAADRTEPASESSTQPPRRSSTTKTPRRSSKPTPPSRPPVSRQSYNNDADDDGSSDDSFVSASSQPKPKSPSLRAKIAEQKRLQSSTYAPSMTAETLSNAMVAGYLASSRASTPSISSGVIQPPAPPPPRRLKKLFHSDHSRTPTPPQSSLSANGVPTMKTTMRKPKTEKELREEEGEGERRRAKKHLVKKHPNKHDEGNRKRWRDEITEKERKRYEALWASNKGLFPYTMDRRGEMVEIEGAADTVPGLVVKDLWERSRLGGDVLEEVWELVHGKGYWGRNKEKRYGRLERDEFVVGLWLIDQRLKGRKLPARVNHSIWASAS
ncbi:putative increased rdna silencing protein 4 protein [Botrytis fragariae]|uniref:Putative increased rdna silencing protein 4 protein n=1 Tax=Botrytis fragariae TaxID=1964551 RepID=A0A8H6B1U6_9HELO|nr:putative increased rdna silencing protein 4 protein [Botrytis fragariae]KAF5877565.1 putative increased rdna silencing protein 4 protein [Botrytis fragariae]